MTAAEPERSAEYNRGAIDWMIANLAADDPCLGDERSEPRCLLQAAMVAEALAAYEDAAGAPYAPKLVTVDAPAESRRPWRRA
jgi:hypothetical protein